MVECTKLFGGKGCISRLSVFIDCEEGNLYTRGKDGTKCVDDNQQWARLILN